MQYEIALFRIAQESLTNVARHAHAERVTIVLAQDGQQIELSIQDVSTSSISISDNGAKGEGKPDAALVPLDADSTNQMKPKLLGGSGLGILGMRERARLLGGTLTVQSQPDHGTTVRAIIPYSEGI